MSRTFKYSPALPGIAAFHADAQSFVRLLVGAVGQGKTLGALAELLAKAATAAKSPDGIRRTRFLVTRASFSQLKTTVLETYKSLVGGDAGGRIVAGESPITHVLRAGDMECEVWFMPAADDADIERMLSLELTGALVSEWTTAPREVVRMLQARVGRYPSKAQGGCMPSWSGLILEGHAPLPDTWQAAMLDSASKGAPTPGGVAAYVLPPAMVRDPDGSWRGNPAGINPHLPQGYYSRLILDQPTDWIRRYVANEQVYTAEGRSVFGGLYSDSLHTLAREFEPDARVPVVIAVDPDLYGSAVLGQFFPGGQVVAFDEVYSNEAGIAALGQALVELMARRYPDCAVSRGWTDPSANTRGVNLQTALEILRANTPWRWEPAPLPKNDLATRLEVTRHVLRTLGDGGKPLLQVSPRCKNLRAALAGRYRWRELKTAGSVIVSEQPVKDEFATIAEALGYLLIGGGIAGVVKGKTQRPRPSGIRVYQPVYRNGVRVGMELYRGEDDY